MAEDWRVLIEAALLAAVLVPVACSGSVRRSLAALGRTRQGVLGAMLLLALGAQFALGTRAFPFVDWKMYASLPAGDPVVFEYDVELRSGRRAALVPGRYMGRESADRFVESLRRRVQAVVPDPLGYLADLPPAHPIGVFRWLPDGLVASGAFKAVLVALLVVCAVGLPGFAFWGVAAAGLLTIHQAVLREFTFVNHEELALLVCTWVLVLFPAADAVSWPRRGRLGSSSHAVALFALAAFLVLPYALIAAHRLAVAAPEVFTGDSLPYWLASLDSLDRDGWGVGRWALGHPALVVALKVGFAVTTVFELLAPLCLVWPRFARVWVVVVVGFHVVNEFTLNLFFWQNAVLALLLIGWSSARPIRR